MYYGSFSVDVPALYNNSTPASLLKGSVNWSFPQAFGPGFGYMNSAGEIVFNDL